ncbi:histidine--tRNA ligase [Candidatus Woesebacteria bacterium]|nr:histidine--tRNA ligase [Candidatus Woesebacteria bacterium]
MVQFQTLKGFRDFLGTEARQRTWLMSVFREVFESRGFEPLETPALEYEELLLGKYGVEANKLIYGFEDRGGRRIALRYDQTVPTARVAVQYKNEITFPYKRYQIQPVWRSDKPQKGRYREFVQCDFDIIGASGPIADAQILATVSAVFEKLGLNAVLKVNDREQLISLIRNAGVPETEIFSVIQTIDKLDKKTSSEVIEELRAKQISQETCDVLFKSIQEAQPSANLVEIIRLAKTLGVSDSQLVFTPTLARGLDYYTGMIFEMVIPNYTAGSVGGGGRYDGLIESLVGAQMPATGVAFGFDRIIDVLGELKMFPANLTNSTKVLVSIFSPENAEYSASVCRLLQKNNIPTELYSDPSRKLESQIKYATAKKIPFIIVAGPEEQQKRVVNLKNLETRGQETVALSRLIDLLTDVDAH